MPACRFLGYDDDRLRLGGECKRLRRNGRDHHAFDPAWRKVTTVELCVGLPWVIGQAYRKGAYRGLIREAARWIAESHHLFPRALAARFVNAGVTEDELRSWLVTLTRARHRVRPLRPGQPLGIHCTEDNWNAAWNQFFDSNPGAKRAAVLAHLNWMVEHIDVEPWL